MTALPSTHCHRLPPTGVRHLANEQSPTEIPSAYSGPAAGTQNLIHRGASPSTPGTGYETQFQTQVYNGGCSCWTVMGTDGNPTLSVTPASGQTTMYAVFGYNSALGWTPHHSRVHLTPALSSGAPAVAAWWSPDESSDAVVNYLDSRYSLWNVWEGHFSGGVWQQSQTYYGSANSIHKAGGGHYYAVQGYDSSCGCWSPFSTWLWVG